MRDAGSASSSGLHIESWGKARPRLRARDRDEVCGSVHGRLSARVPVCYEVISIVHTFGGND